MEIFVEIIDGNYCKSGKVKENYIFLREKNHEEKKFPVVSGKEREYLMPEI